MPARQLALTYPPFDELTKLVYAEPGVGKTTFCAQDPGAFFIATEPGHDFVKTGVYRAFRWGVDPTGKDTRANFQDVVRALWEAKSSGKLKELGYKTAVVDIVDNLASMCLDHVCAMKGIAYPPENDFGKTWKEIRVEWETWMRRLMDLVNVTFVTHCGTDNIELLQANGIKKEITRRIPTFRGNKQAQFLDGILNVMGYMYRAGDGKVMISFKSDPSLGTKDRTDVFEKIGPIQIDKEGGFAKVAAAYAAKAKELGINLKSKWEN